MWFYNLVIIITLIFQSSCNKQTTIGPYGEDFFTKDELSSLDLNISVSLAQNKQGHSRLIIEESFNPVREYMGLQLPNNFMRQKNLFELIENLHVDNAEIVNHETMPFVKLLKTNKKKITLRYAIKPFVEENFTSPVIKNDYFQFVGSMALITFIALEPETSFNIRFTWNLPKEFQIFNSFTQEQQSHKQEVSLNKLWDSLFLAGSNLRAFDMRINNNPTYIVFNGYWDKMKDEYLIETLKKLITTQRNTWQDHNFPHFLVSFLSLNKDCNNKVQYAGTAHQNSFRAYFPRTCPFMAEMYELISHELMHTWLGKKIVVGKERGKIDGKWFSEGFCDYYGRLMSYRADLISEDVYFNSLNKEIEHYFLSSALNTSLYELVDKMYKESSNNDLEKLPYQQGELIAIELNKIIKNNSNQRYSLDDPIRDMIKEANNNNGYKNFGINDIKNIFKKYINTDIIDSFLSKIINGQPIIPTKFPGCKDLVIKTKPSFKKTPIYTNNPIFYYKDSIYDNDTCSKWLE